MEAAVAVAVTAARARVADQPFKASKKFDGSIEGMVYRTGTDGLGYYPDVEAVNLVSLHLDLFPLDSVVPIQLPLLPLLAATLALPRCGAP